MQGSNCDTSSMFYPFCNNSDCAMFLSTAEHGVFALLLAKTLFLSGYDYLRGHHFMSASLYAYLHGISSAVLLPSHWVLPGTYAKLSFF